MLVNNEHRHQYVYFFLSGVLASAILILIYVSLRTTANEKLKDNVKFVQMSLDYIKPATPWNYNNTWRPIGNATRRHKIYSAYFDPRTEIVTSAPINEAGMVIGSIRIFAILPFQFKDVISCILRYDDFTLKEIVAEDQTPMHEDHDKPYCAYTIMCPLRVNRQSKKVRLPQAAAIAYASNWLSHLSPTFVPISYPRNITAMFEKSKPVLSVCIGPLQLGYSDVLRLVEFVEMYRIQGASHFYFYHLNASADVLRTLHYYQQQGLVSLLDWKLAQYTEDELHYGGIFAQFNECIYRAAIVDNFRYAAVVDLDEVMLPLKHNSLRDFLRQCDEGRTSGYVFRNVFFYKKDSNDTFSVPPHTRNRRLYTQTKMRRTVEIMPAYTRSKCIVNTRAVIEMRNHQVWRDAPGYSDNILHISVGLLFHYRDKCINCKAHLIVDYTARRFGSLIWERVDDACLSIYLENGGYCPYS